MAKPVYFGKYRAYVSDVDDPMKMGRIRVNCPSVTGGLTKWCLPCIPVTYNNGGDFHFPKVGETVFIEFEDGDINYPIYTGGWLAENTCPIPSYDPDTRIISWGDNVIYMEKDKLTIRNSKCNVVLNNSDVEINAEDKVDILGSKTINIKTDSSVSIEGKDKVNVKSSTGLTITTPNSEMNFENGEMHFTTDLGSIDIEEEEIKVTKDNSTVVFKSDSIIFNNGRMKIDKDNVTISANDPLKGEVSAILDYDVVSKLKEMGG